MLCALTFDLGGTSAKVALVSASGAVLAQETIPTPASSDPLVVLRPFAEAGDRLLSRALRESLAVVAVGCGVPGNMDPTRATVLINNIVALDGFALGPWLRERFGLPVSLDNDACAAAIGETSLLEGHGAGRVLFVTVGSGIGFVLVVDGEVVRIFEGVTGDASHILVDHRNPNQCQLGCHGCLEVVASALAIQRAGRAAAREGRSKELAEVLRAKGDVTGADVSAAAASGDGVSRTIIQEAGRWLGIGLAGLVPIYGPDLIILGGGVARAGDEWMSAVAKSLHEQGIPHYVGRVDLRRALLGNQAGVIGAGLLALREAMG